MKKPVINVSFNKKAVNNKTVSDPIGYNKIKTNNNKIEDVKNELHIEEMEGETETIILKEVSTSYPLMVSL